MNKRHKIAIYGLITGAALFLFTNLFGCSTTAEEKTEKLITKTETTTEVKHGNHSCCDNEDAGEISSGSVYQLESEWTDQDGHMFLLKNLKGKKVVLTMFYASCTYACPILVQDMKRIETALEEKNSISSYKFVLASIDPERDTPGVVKDFAKKNKFNLNRWTILTASPDDVMELAAVTGFKYKKDKEGNYSHSNLITFLNEEGEIIHQQVGLNQDITNSLTYLNTQN